MIWQICGYPDNRFFISYQNLFVNYFFNIIANI